MFNFILVTFVKKCMREKNASSNNKTRKKVKTIKGGKGSCDDPTLSNTFTFKSPLLGKHRIKNYGNNKFTTSYIDLKIYRKDIA